MKFAALAFVVAVLAAGCSRQTDDGPPKVRWGQDECAHCGMIVSDERFAAALRVIGEGEQRDLLFDDIGDMIAYERENPGLTVQRQFVRDFDSRQWIDATTAKYVKSEKIQTPMGSGIVAFADPTKANELATREQGQVVQLTAMKTAAKTSKKLPES